MGVNYLDVCKNSAGLFVDEWAKTAYIGILEVLNAKQSLFSFEYPCHSPDQQRWFRMTISPLQGWRYGAVVSHENITQQKQREKQDKAHLDELAHITRLGLMGEMASGIAHEVNQPLAAINSYAQASINLGQL